MKPVVVVGAGWAGLAAAVELSRQRIPVVLLEAGGQAGGRARRVTRGDEVFDNGRHLFLGAFREILSLLDVIGVAEGDVFERTPLQLWIRSAQRDVYLALPDVPAPFHLVRGLQGVKGLSLGERLRAVRLGLSLAKHRFAVERDIGVSAWMERHHQSPALIHGIWNPFCLATLNTPAAEASAQVFLRVLHDAFLRSRKDSDLLMPKTDLGRLFPDPAVAYLEGRGGTLRLETEVTGLSIRGDAIEAVETPNGPQEAAQVILAVPYYRAADLLGAHAQFDAVSANLSRITATPITTVYLEYPAPVSLEVPFMGIVNDNPYWVFDGTRRGRPARITVVISGAGAHTQMDDEPLAGHIAATLARYCPKWPRPTGHTIMREARATFASRTGINALRPGCRTPVRGLWLAGDYTDTGYPSTLEGAVKSGVTAARRLIQDSR